MATRVRVTFAGITFSGFAHGSQGDHITVPTNAFRKILASGKLTARLCYDIEHDGNGANDLFNRTANVETIQKKFEEWKKWQERPWLLYLDPINRVLHYCPHSNQSYELKEVE
jgi:hypothetical protein